LGTSAGIDNGEGKKAEQGKGQFEEKGSGVEEMKTEKSAKYP